MARVLLFTGGARSGREHAIDTLAAEEWGHSLLIVPTRHEAYERATRIVTAFRLNGAWGHCVVSFEDFVLSLLREGRIFPHLLDDVERRLVIDGAVDRLRAHAEFSSLGGAAGTPGFTNHLLRVVTKLKQAAVEPEAFRAAIACRKRPSWLDPIVAAVYETYQNTLHRTESYDRVGLYWRANVLLREGDAQLPGRVNHVLFDGFDDFTPSEFRVIEQLPRYVDTLVLGLVCDPNIGSQEDLYRIPLETTKQLLASFPQCEQKSFSEPAPTSRIAYVTSNLFWRDRPPKPGPLNENLELHACHDTMHECEWIGRTIKSLVLESSVAPQRIAVVFRRMDNAATRLRIVFKEFGIPVNIHSPIIMLNSSFARFLLRLIDVTGKWDREDVLDVLVSAWAGAPEQYVGAYSMLARAAGVIEGQQEWISSVERLVAWLKDGTGEERERLLRRVPEAVPATSSLLERLRTLAEWLKTVPAKATRSEHIEALLTLVARLQAEKTAQTFADEDMRTFESEAIRTLYGSLRRLRAWEAQLNGTGPIELSEFQAELHRILSETAIPADEEPVGVAVMSAETARYREFEYLFLAGMNEGEFPSPPAIDAVYSDEDWEDLEKAGAKAERRERQIDREMLLLHHVLGRARQRAWVSWCSTGPDGRPLAPSPFVEDIKGLLGDPLTQPVGSTSFVPLLRDAASPRDLRNARCGHDVESSFAEIFAPVRAGLEVEAERNRRAPFGPYDGVLTAPDALARLREIYGPEHTFSAAQLETYSECPFQFFLERILRIEPMESPSTEFDPRTRGRILHEVLQQFHSTYRGVPPHAIPIKEGHATLSRLCQDIFDRRAREEVAAPPGVVRVERARMQAQLTRYFDLAHEEEETWGPGHFEVGFGAAHANSGDALSNPAPFPLETPAGTVLLSGRIDRIDFKDGEARVVDYKTTLYYIAKDVTEGVHLQMPLYAIALQEFLKPGVTCVEALLIQPGKTGRTEVLQKARGKWPERETAMREGVARAVTGIRSGQFPPMPYKAQCQDCASSRVCRYEQRRNERKVEKNGASDT